MAVSCTPADLAEAAKCFTCLDPAQREIIKTYLLAVIAGGSTDPATLLEEAKCFACLDPNQRKLINTYLLCQAANAGGTPAEQLIETVPENLGERFGIFSYYNDDVTEFTWNGTETTAGFDLSFIYNLVSFDFPNLAEIDPGSLQGGYFSIDSCQDTETISLPLLTYCDQSFNVSSNASLVSLNAPLLATCGDSLSVMSNTSLTSVSLPSLVSVTAALNMSGCTSLASVSLPLYLPTNTRAQNFGNCALAAASVNHILARCVANAGYVSGTITLSGGTNAAPTGQGIVDKATLIGRGCTVNTN